MATSEKEYKFKKLQGAENFKQWSRDMTFALQEAKLWEHISGTAMRPPELKSRTDDDEDRQERIWQRSEKIRDFDQDVQRATAKISKMCSSTVQKEFLSLHKSTEWKPKDLWEWLEKRYTLQNFASKWTALGKLHGIQHSECKNITDYMSQIKDARSEIEDLKISMDDAIVIHALNNLDSQFRPYLTILNHEARQKAKLPTLSELTKSLEDEELRLKNESTASANFAKKGKSKSTSYGNCTNTGKKSTEDLDQKNEECKTCGDSHHGDCWHLTAECFQCHETGHISANCPKNKKKKMSTSSCSSNHKPRTSENLASKGKGKKMNYFSQKVAFKQQPEQALASSSITFRQQ